MACLGLQIPEITALPAKLSYVALYLLSVLQASSSRPQCRRPFTASGGSPTCHTLPQKSTRVSKAEVIHQVSKKAPFTAEILLKFYHRLDSSLVDARFMVMELLAYAGLMRFAELSNLRLKDVAESILHTLNFSLKGAKPTNYAKAQSGVPIVKTGTDLCPWANLVKYLAQAANFRRRR